MSNIKNETVGWKKLASKEEIQKTIESLKKNGFFAELAEDGEDAKKKVLDIIPEGSEVMNMTSVTLETLGIAEEIAKSGKYNDVRKKFERMMADKKQKREMKKIGAAPEYAIGSVHAITQNGEILIASGTGSQLPAYAYGSDKVIFVVGTQKIVKNLDEGIRRIYEHSLPLESERAKKAYGVPGSSVNKILIINKEVSPSRIHILFVNRVLGF